MKAIIVTNSATITWVADSENDAALMGTFRDNWQAWLSGNNPNDGADINLPDGRTVPVDYRDIVRVDIGDPR